MPDLESHWLAKRLAFLSRSLTRDTVWGQKVKKAFLAILAVVQMGGLSFQLFPFAPK